VASVRVHTFSSLFGGLPAGGPFDLKLLAWLNLAGIPYEHAFEDDTRKGPKGANPWIAMWPNPSIWLPIPNQPMTS